MNQEEKVRLNVEIFGTTYKMVGSFSEKYMKQVSAYVNENMGSIAKGNPRLDTQKVAVLALVHMADEYFQLRAKWDAVESERSQSKQHIEELRKAFELSEEKERGKSNEVRYLQDRVTALEKENTRIAEEFELASLEWAEQAEKWEGQYAEAVREGNEARSELEVRIRDLQNDHDRISQELLELHAKWDAVESERSQSKGRIEELRQALEQSEEKVHDTSNEIKYLQDRIAALEKENIRIAEEEELASLVWAEQVEEWEGKYAAAVRDAEATRSQLEARIIELQKEHEQALDQLHKASAVTSERTSETHSAQAASGPALSVDPALLEKYKKLQEEYTKLQNEFNEWIQLTQSETQ